MKKLENISCCYYAYSPGCFRGASYQKAALDLTQPEPGAKFPQMDSLLSGPACIKFYFTVSSVMMHNIGYAEAGGITN